MIQISIDDAPRDAVAGDRVTYAINRAGAQLLGPIQTGDSSGARRERFVAA
jgi:hypothetical protein